MLESSVSALNSGTSDRFSFFKIFFFSTLPFIKEMQQRQTRKVFFVKQTGQSHAAKVEQRVSC